MYTMDKMGNVRTHLSIRKLKPNNKEKNNAIYGTGPSYETLKVGIFGVILRVCVFYLIQLLSEKIKILLLEIKPYLKTRLKRLSVSKREEK